MHVDRDGVAIQLDIAGDYYEGSAGGAVLTSIALNGAAFWGELTDEERRQAEHILTDEAEKDEVRL